MRRVTFRRGAVNGALLAFLASVALLAGLIFLLVWKPKKPLDRSSLTVYVAAGLKDAFNEVAQEYEREYGIQVEGIFAGSDHLLAQIQVTGKGDLYIPADSEYIDKAGGFLEERFPAARMMPVLAVKQGNPKQIASLKDLLREDVNLSLALPKAAAVGKLSKQVLEKAKLWDAVEKKQRLVFKPTVSEVAADLILGSSDAGIVWDATVTQAEGKIEIIPVPELKGLASNVTLGVLKSSKHPTGALRFARYLTSRDRGLKSFAKYGFLPVPDADLWADGEPKISLLAGAMLRPAIAPTIESFAEREGIPLANINVVYDGCGLLVSQMKLGKQNPDAFFACDASFMEMVKSKFTDEMAVSTNQLVILVHKGNPHKIGSLDDLAKPGLKVGVGHEQQCALGALTQTTLEESRIKGPVEKNIVVKVPTGDMLVNKMLAAPSSLDAVIAYVSNAAKAEDKLDKVTIDIPCSIATQPIALGKETNHKYLMQRLVRALRSEESRQRFESNGFKWK